MWVLTLDFQRVLLVHRNMSIEAFLYAWCVPVGSTNHSQPMSINSALIYCAALLSRSSTVHLHVYVRIITQLRYYLIVMCELCKTSLEQCPAAFNHGVAAAVKIKRNEQLNKLHRYGSYLAIVLIQHKQHFNIYDLCSCIIQWFYCKYIIITTINNAIYVYALSFCYLQKQMCAVWR